MFQYNNMPPTQPSSKNLNRNSSENLASLKENHSHHEKKTKKNKNKDIGAGANDLRKSEQIDNSAIDHPLITDRNRTVNNENMA